MGMTLRRLKNRFLQMSHRPYKSKDIGGSITDAAEGMGKSLSEAFKEIGGIFALRTDRHEYK